MKTLLRVFVTLLLCGLLPASAQEPPLSQDVLLMADEGLIGLHLTATVAGQDVHKGWLAYLDEMLRTADADADGETTWEELAPRLPAPGEIQFLVNAGGARDIADRNVPSALGQRRGRATPQGLHESLSSLGFGPLVFRYASEGTPSPAGTTQSFAQQFAGVMLFSRLDRDGNGRLSRAELAEGLTTLQHLDENEDDLLTPVELDSTNRQGVNIRLNSASVRSTDTGPFLVLPLGERTDAAIRTLLRRYDHAPARDGLLTPAELGWSATQVERYDANKSGTLDRKELAAMLQQPPLRYDVACDLPAGGRPAVLKVTPRDASDVAPVEEPGRISVQFARLQLGFAGINAPEFDAGAQARRWLQTLDRDANDYLDETELRNFGLAPLFKLVDRDGDGKATADELTGWAATRVRLFAQQLVITAGDSSRNLFASIDTNRDGRLSAAEFRHGAEQLATWDANGDGELSDLEIPQRMSLTFARDSSPVLAQRLGIAQPVAAVEAPSPSAAASAPAWFAAMDRNGDGEISRQEFVGPLARFQKLDANSDGRIDVGEAGSR